MEINQWVVVVTLSLFTIFIFDATDGLNSEQKVNVNCPLKESGRSSLNRYSKLLRCANGRQLLPEQMCDGILDCEDGSDENNLTLCAIKPYTCGRDEFTCANRKCVPLASQCTMEDDCGDQSDEMGCNPAGSCNDNTCAHGCSPGIGNGAAYLCHCAQGFKIGPDHRSCVDIDECASFQVHHCPQLCENTAGSYSCRCKPGFVWSHFRCLATGAPAVILYGMRTQLLQRAKETVSYFFHGITNIRALDLDPVEKVIYWVDSDALLKRSLVPNISANAPTAGKEQILAESDMITTGISIDWVARNLYWAERASESNINVGHIKVTTIDGRYAKILISDNVQSPMDIAISPEVGQMVWTESGCSPRLETAWMDGTHRRILVYMDILRPIGVTIDYHLKHRVFWCDNVLNRIETINLDGSDRIVVVSGDDLQNPVRLDVVGLSLYWSTNETHKLLRVDKFGRGSQVTVSTHVGRIFDFRVFQTLKQNINVYNACRSKLCSHLCLLNPVGAICACPEGTNLRRFSRKQCNADIQPQRPALQRCSCKSDQVCKVDVVAQELYCI